MKREIKVTVDIVLIDSERESPHVLLIRRKHPPFENFWALPGGFVEVDESPHAAACRELEEETGMRVDRLKQLHTFGEPGRDPRGPTISIAHYAVLSRAESERMAPNAGSDAAEAKWFPLDHLPDLAFDHGKIIAYTEKFQDILSNE